MIQFCDCGSTVSPQLRLILHPPLHPRLEAFGLCFSNSEGAAASTARRATRPGAKLAKRFEGLLTSSCPLLVGLLHASLLTAWCPQPNIIKGSSTHSAPDAPSKLERDLSPQGEVADAAPPSKPTGAVQTRSEVPLAAGIGQEVSERS